MAMRSPSPLEPLVLALAAMLGAAAPATAAVVAGIDFGTVSGNVQLGAGTLATSFVNGTGQTISSYGLITTVNGRSTYCADGTSNCALYFIGSSTVSATPGTDLYQTGSTVTLYRSGSAPINLMAQGSAANLAFIGGLSRWATLQGTNGVDPTSAGLASDGRLTQMLSGASITVAGSRLLSVSTASGSGDAAVASFLNSNTIPTFTGAFADVVMTQSANNFVINPFDAASAAADSCRTGAPQVGDWCLAGSMSQRGRTEGGTGAQAPAAPTGPGAASTVVVGGIDFGPTGVLSQLGTGTLARSFVNGAGQVSTSFGVIGSVNGDTTYCADGSANCALYVVTTQTVTATPGTDLYLGDSRTTVYYAPTAAIDLNAQDAAASLAYITGLSKWATLRGETGVDPTAAGLVSSERLAQALAGASISTGGGGLLSVDRQDGLGLADVEAFLDGSTIPTFSGAFADLAWTEASNNFVLNARDLAGAGGDSCLTGAPQVGDWCLAGAMDWRGTTVYTPTDRDLPLPGTLALALLAAAAWRGVERRGGATR